MRFSLSCLFHLLQSRPTAALTDADGRLHLAVEVPQDRAVRIERAAPVQYKERVSPVQVERTQVYSERPAQYVERPAVQREVPAARHQLALPQPQCQRTFEPSRALHRRFPVSDGCGAQVVGAHELMSFRGASSYSSATPMPLGQGHVSTQSYSAGVPTSFTLGGGTQMSFVSGPSGPVVSSAPYYQPTSSRKASGLYDP
jgi:hypothetical protein